MLWTRGELSVLLCQVIWPVLNLYFSYTDTDSFAAMTPTTLYTPVCSVPVFIVVMGKQSVFCDLFHCLPMKS